jgi:hypothetical protein
MPQMTVNFNNLRKQTAYSYHRLAQKLNYAIKSNDLPPSIVEDIQEDMDDLRRLIMSICCVYEKDNEDFKDVSEEVEKSGEIALFNPEFDE